MANCIDLPERDRLANLLGRLRACDSLDDVPLKLLAEPEPDTWPSIKLVARYPDYRQMFMVKASTRAVFAPAWRVGLVIAATVLAASTDLTTWLVSVIGWPWLAQVAAPRWCQLPAQHPLRTRAPFCGRKAERPRPA